MRDLLIFAAQGRGSLPSDAAERLEAVAKVSYRPTLAPLKDEDLLAACADAEVLGLTRRACRDFHRGLIERLPRLRGLAVYATGAEWLDVAALEARGIAWRVLPDYSAQTVAEHALALLLTLSRRVHLSDRVVRGDLPESVSLRGWELAGKRIGVIGLGRIGSRIARLLQAFGAEVVYCDPAVAQSPYAQALGMEALLRTSRAVVVASSVGRDAPPLLDAQALGCLPHGAFLINPSRPQLVDSLAVVQAITAGHLAGYAVDERVFTAEQLARVAPGRIVQTGHTAWYSDEAMARGVRAWVDHMFELVEQS